MPLEGQARELRNVLLNDRLKFLEIERLLYHRDTSGCFGLVLIKITKCGHSNYRDLLKFLVLPDNLHSKESISNGHCDVHQYKIRLLNDGLIHRLNSVDGLNYIVPITS